jgi:hypothetical protein
MSTHALKAPSLLETKRQRSKHPEEQEAGQMLSGVLKAHANFVAWLVSLGFGGALLVLYYSHIHYFPELDWKDSLTYLAALSFLGGTIAVLYGLLLFFPGVIWCEFLIHDSKLEDKLCYKVDDGPYEACYRVVGLHMALPFLVFMLVMHFVALAESLWIIAATAIGLLALISVVLIWLLQKQIGETEDGILAWLRKHFGKTGKTKDAKKKGETPSPGSASSLVLKYVGLFNVSALISLTSLLFLYAIVNPGEGSWRMFLICTVVVVVTNVLVAVQYRRRPGRAVLTAILAALVLLGCGESLAGPQAAISSRLMARFGIGGDPVTLVVKEGAKDIFACHAVPFEVRSSVVIVRNARILSRLGTDYFVEAGGRRVAIPRDLVISWQPRPAVESWRELSGGGNLSAAGPGGYGWQG